MILSYTNCSLALKEPCFFFFFSEFSPYLCPILKDIMKVAYGFMSRKNCACFRLKQSGCLHVP